MSLVAIDFTLPSKIADVLGDALLESGALSVSVVDALEGMPGEKPIFGEPGASRELWSECRTIVLFKLGTDIEAIVRRVAATHAIEIPAYAISQVEDIDWVRASRDQFQPIRISDRLCVVPTWHEKQHLTPHANAVNLILDPGAAFGTGSHPTTKLCLLWLEKTLAGNAGCALLDYGCGSGILAIAAMKLGAGRAVAVDIDELALDTARFNAGQNHVVIECHSPDDYLDMQADLTVANILANPLIVLAPLLAARTRLGGKIALSGVLASQADEVLQAYLPMFDIALDSSEEDWVCLAGTRRALDSCC